MWQLFCLIISCVDKVIIISIYDTNYFISLYFNKYPGIIEYHVVFANNLICELITALVHMKALDLV